MRSFKRILTMIAFCLLVGWSPCLTIFGQTKDENQAELKKKLDKELKRAQKILRKDQKGQEKEKQKVQKICDAHPSWTQAVCLAVARKQTWVGMNQDMLLEVMGRPSSVNTTRLEGGHWTAQLVYRYLFYDYTDYVYLEDGIVTAIQREH